MAEVLDKVIIRESERKLARIEKKKRKLKAFLELVNDKNVEEIAKDGEVSKEEALKKLKECNVKRQKLMMEKPKFFLTEEGRKARKSGEGHSLSCENIQALILASMIPSPRLGFKPTFCEVLRPNKAVKVAIYLIDNVNLEFDETEDSLFTEVLRFEPTVGWLDELLAVTLNRNQHKRYVEHVLNGDSGGTGFTPVSRMNLLLSLEQMALEGYPLPPPLTNFAKTLRKKYKPATNESPLFAIDCEMCLTSRQKNELTRISVINENMEVVFDTLVKPEHEIVDYLTRFSGITANLMKNVNVTLKDVQRRLRKIIPRNGIICGHSLNFDLQALDLIHPYVIDTSVIYNMSGFKGVKPSLKNLAYEFLNESIQESKQGHCSVEDAKTTLKLVQLKLKKGLEFGDKSIGVTEFGSFVPIGQYTKLKDVDLNVFYDYFDTDESNRFVCVVQSPHRNLKQHIMMSLATDKCTCIVVSSDGLCRVKF